MYAWGLLRGVGPGIAWLRRWGGRGRRGGRRPPSPRCWGSQCRRQPPAEIRVFLGDPPPLSGEGERLMRGSTHRSGWSAYGRQSPEAFLMTPGERGCGGSKHPSDPGGFLSDPLGGDAGEREGSQVKPLPPPKSKGRCSCWGRPLLGDALLLRPVLLFRRYFFGSTLRVVDFAEG